MEEVVLRILQAVFEDGRKFEDFVHADGQIHPIVTLANRLVFALQGTIAKNWDGGLRVDGSSSAIFCRDASTMEVGCISPNQIKEVIGTVDPNEIIDELFASGIIKGPHSNRKNRGELKAEYIERVNDGKSLQRELEKKSGEDAVGYASRIAKAQEDGLIAKRDRILELSKNIEGLYIKKLYARSQKEVDAIDALIEQILREELEMIDSGQSLENKNTEPTNTAHPPNHNLHIISDLDIFEQAKLVK